jgi:demethylmenaquinone methyltransferase/2-methoxy-6-polyprenyl-1,4-benzoquinol methylase
MLQAARRDLSLAFARRVGTQTETTAGRCGLPTSITPCSVVGRDRLLDAGIIAPVAQCDAEKLPFPDNYFDIVTVAFGLRNMTHKDQALSEMLRVLRPGGRLLVLEFSKVWAPLEKIYDAYSFKLLPWLGEKIAGDAASYR